MASPKSRWWYLGIYNVIQSAEDGALPNSYIEVGRTHPFYLDICLPSFPRVQMTHHEDRAELLNEIIAFLPFLHSFNQWIIVLFSFHSNELSAMDTVIHSNRNTNRWVIDLHAFITLEFRMAFGAIKSFICQSEIPGLSPGRGSDWLFCKRWSPFVVPLISCFSEDRIWQAELCRYKATAGTTIGLRDIYRGACVDATTEYKEYLY